MKAGIALNRTLRDRAGFAAVEYAMVIGAAAMGLVGLLRVTDIEARLAALLTAMPAPAG